MTFQFADLFSGVGGFHFALSKLGGKCVFASEIDPAASRLYFNTFKLPPLGDVAKIVPLEASRGEKIDVLCAGFPCQPFSKSGAQKGIREARGTLFFEILLLAKELQPSILLLENVRNLAGPRHTETFSTIVRLLRDLGYNTSSSPLVFSPHLLPPELGGTPQIRDRVFIIAAKDSRGAAPSVESRKPLVEYSPVGGWNPTSWNLRAILDPVVGMQYGVKDNESKYIDVWGDFISRLRCAGAPVPKFPIWADEFMPNLKTSERDFEAAPVWKKNILRKNWEFFERFKEIISSWVEANPCLMSFPPTRRKLEWQAQDTETLDQCLIHFRPSGIRAKKATYAPALVAITQTTVLGWERRRLTPAEAARLQGMTGLDLESQPDKESYKQLGNAVHVGVARFLFCLFIEKNLDWALTECPHIVEATRDFREQVKTHLTRASGSLELV